uniref:Uncharacterized protein n=1 Tax=Setaria digitata TaxID=48799 RepID=A0A915PLF2_9BILA
MYSGIRRMPQWAILLVVLSSINLSDGNDYCGHYAICQQHLEVEERRCVKLEERSNYESARCSESIDIARASVDGLRLRKAELERDCVMRGGGSKLENLNFLKEEGPIITEALSYVGTMLPFVQVSVPFLIQRDL